MTKGILLTISAPSGTGKSTLIKMLTREYPEFGFSISYTTRAPRPGEKNGKDYFFIDAQEFTSLIKQNFFAEWAKVHGNYYGTPRKQVLQAINSGQSLIFDIDVQGASQLKKNLNTGLFVFIFPPSLKILENRLRQRGSEDAETIRQRISNAAQEIRQSNLFDFWIINDDLDTACNELKALIRAEKLRPCYEPDLPQKIINTGDQLH
ncbi:MAG: guanylate kinase [Desulfonatronovibrio sp.]